MFELRATTQDEILRKLAAIDINVAPRKDGRTSEQTEFYSICRALSTLKSTSHLSYPLKLLKSERPDFVIHFNGVPAIGVEVTEVVDEDFVKAETLPESSKDDSVLDRSLFRWGTPKRGLDELREIASRTSLTGLGWEGRAAEIEFANAMADRIRSKTAKLREDSFTRFSQNWLLLYNNLQLPMLDLIYGLAVLIQELERYWDENGFTAILIESGSQLVMLEKHSISTYRIINVW